MINRNRVVIKILSILLSVTIIFINLYALINKSISFSVTSITNILFIAFFALLGIKEIIEKNKTGYIYFVFILIMVILFLVKLYLSH